MGSNFFFKSLLFILAATFALSVENIFAIGMDCESQVLVVNGSPRIPTDRYQIILETLRQVKAIVEPKLKMPKNIKFLVDSQDQHFGHANNISNVIELPPMAIEELYKISDNLERAYAWSELHEVNRQLISVLDGQLWGPQTSQR